MGCSSPYPHLLALQFVVMLYNTANLLPFLSSVMSSNCSNLSFCVQNIHHLGSNYVPKVCGNLLSNSNL